MRKSTNGAYLIHFPNVVYSEITVIVFIFAGTKVRGFAVFNIFMGIKVHGFVMFLYYALIKNHVNGYLSSRMYANRENRKL